MLTRDDIIRLRKEAGFSADHPNPAIASYVLERFERFAQLVEAEVSEKAAAALVAEGVSEYERGLKDGAALERTACADLLRHLREGIHELSHAASAAKGALQQAETHIRARGKKGGV